MSDYELIKSKIQEILEETKKEEVFFSVKYIDGVSEILEFEEKALDPLIDLLREKPFNEILKGIVLELDEYLPSEKIFQILTNKEEFKEFDTIFEHNKYWDFFDIIIELDREEDYDKISDLINKNIDLHVNYRPKILEFIKKFILKTDTLSKNKSILENIILNNPKYKAREDAVDILYELENTDNYSFLIELFKKSQHWGVQRKILDKLFSHSKSNLDLLNFYFEMLENGGDFNYGVRFNLWRNIFYYFNLNDEEEIRTMDTDIISKFNNLILKECYWRSIQVIMGYKPAFGTTRSGGILYTWLNFALKYPRLYDGLINHEKSYVYEDVFYLLNEKKDSNVKFSFIKELIFYLKNFNANNYEEKINLLLEEFSKDLTRDIVNEVIDFLRTEGLKNTQIYPKAILMQDSEEPYLSVKFGIVGIGGGGKTCLSHYLEYDGPLYNSITTYGLNLSRIKPPQEHISLSSLGVKEKAKLEIKLFDFGGQQFFWASHKFFFQKIKGFLVIFTGIRADNSIRIAVDWLDKINKYYEKLPEIFLVKTKHDMSSGPLPISSLNKLKNLSNSDIIYEVCSVAEAMHKDQIGTGIQSLRKDMFTNINWSSIQQYNVSAAMIEIIEFIREKIVSKYFYILKKKILDLVKDNLTHINESEFIEELEKSLIKLEEEGDIIIYFDLIVLDPDVFSRFTSKMCQIAQDNQGIIKQSDVSFENFYDVLPDSLNDEDKQFITEKIISILINKESCFPDFLEGEKVLIFYEDIREKCSNDEIYFKNYDFIKWLFYNKNLKKGQWEKLVAIISITPGFNITKIWKKIIKLKYKNQKVIIREISINKGKFKFIIEVLIAGVYGNIIGTEISNLIVEIIRNEFFDNGLLGESYKSFRGKYEYICQECGELIETQNWIIPFVLNRNRVDCLECYSENEMISLEVLEVRDEIEKTIMDLYPYSKKFYDLYIYKNYKEPDEAGLEYIDYGIDDIKNHLSKLYLPIIIHGVQQILIKLYGLESGQDLLLKGQAAILPEIHLISIATEEDYTNFLKFRGRGNIYLRNKYKSFLTKLRLKKFIKIEFACLKCRNIYPFLLILKENPKLRKYIKFGISLALSFTSISESEIWELIKNVSDSMQEFFEIKEEIKGKDIFDFSKFTQRERELLTQSLEGIFHNDHIYEIFPKIQRINGSLSMICGNCE